MPPLNTTHNHSVLSSESVTVIQNASLRVLEQQGVKVIDPGVRRLLQEAGAAVSGDIVHLPEKLVIDSLRKSPPVVTFYSRDGGKISSQDGYGYHSPAPSAVAIKGSGGERRQSTFDDVVNLTRLADALPGIDFISPPAIAQDCAAEYSGVRTAEAVICNTNKFCLAFPLNLLEAYSWVEMAENAAGSARKLNQKPSIGFAISPISPLVLAKESSDILMLGLEYGLPVVTVPGGMTGATTPYSLAGTLVVDHAEALLVVVIAQIFRPGNPCVLGLATAAMDMRSGNISLGKPERTLILNAVTPLAHAWGLPGYAPAGLTDSFGLDIQAGAEKMMSLLTHLQSGLEFCAGAGRYEGGLTTSLEGLLIDHELLQMARRYMQGIQVDEGTLAEATIAQVGPAGNFLGDEHTIRHLRSNEYAPLQLFNRRSQSSGGFLVSEVAHQNAVEILAKYPSPVSETQQAEYRRIIRTRLNG